MQDKSENGDPLPGTGHEKDPATADAASGAPASPTETFDSAITDLAPGVPRKVGQYRIKRAIASGGMGTVYEALQERPRRTVAVKFMRAGIASPSALRRFEFEAQLLARLRHPGIAQVYEAGTHQDGDATIPYFAMEYIVGAKPITDYVREKKLGTRERVRLFIKVCDAVHHGHQKGIIHRDLKPSNILVDSSGQVKIIDFGVARSTDSDMAVTTLQTDVGSLLGTVQYMSPEQCAADPHDIDTRSDVYALGVVLFEILTGQPPYELRGTALHEATRIIREQPPTRPSTVDRALRGDLETIALTALEKDRDRRYQSASALTADLKRYLNEEAISARPPSVSYQLRVFARRNKGVFAALAAVFAVLVVGVVASTTLYFRAEAARSEAATRAAQLEQVAAFQEAQLTGIDVSLMGIRMRRGLLDGARAAANGGADGDGDARVAQLEPQLAGIDFTGLSRDLLDESVFAAAIDTIDQQFASQPAIQARLLQALANTVRDLGLLDRATEAQARALSIRREVLGDDHPETLDSMHQQAVVLAYKGQLQESEAQLNLTIDGCRRVLGGTPQTYDTIGDLGVVLLQLQRVEEAEGHFQEALDGLLRTAGEDDRKTLMAYNNLGVSLSMQGKLEEAESLYRKALAGNENAYGPDHADTLTSMFNLSALLRKTDKNEEAERLLLQAIDGMRRKVGHLHPRTIQMEHELAHRLMTDGRTEEALGSFRSSYEGSRSAFGEDGMRTVKTAGCYGFALNELNRSDDAEPFLRMRVDGYRRIFGVEHAETLTSMGNLAYAWNKLGRQGEVVRLLEPGTNAARTAWAEKDPGRLGTYLARLGEAHAGLQRLAIAEPLLLEAYDLQASAFGDEDAHTVATAESIVALYDAWNARAPGQGYAAKAAEWRSRVTGGNDAG